MAINDDILFVQRGKLSLQTEKKIRVYQEHFRGLLRNLKLTLNILMRKNEVIRKFILGNSGAHPGDIEIVPADEFNFSRQRAHPCLAVEVKTLGRTTPVWKYYTAHFLFP